MIAAVFAIAGLALVGWVFDIATLKSVSPQWTSMHKITILCFFMSAAALTFSREGTAGRRAAAARVSGVVVSAAGLITAATYLFELAVGREWSPGTWPVLRLFLTEDTRMAAITAIVFSGFGCVLILFASRSRRAAGAGHAMLLPLAVMAYLVLVGYLFGIKDLYEWSQPAVALNTGVALLALCIAGFCARPDTWLMKVFTSEEAGGTMARRLMPALFILPLIIGWLRLSGEVHGYFTSPVGVALVVVTYTICFVAVVWLVAASVNRADRRRRDAEEAVRLSEERFRSLFSTMTEGFALHEIVLDETGTPCDYRFVEINPAFEKLTGMRRGDVVGKKHSEILPGDDPTWVKAYGEVALTGASAHFENYSPALKRHYEVFAYRPAPLQFAVVFSDITERKEREEALSQLNRTLRALGDSSQAMLRAKDEAEYLKGVCRIIVEDCGHAMVWIGYAEDDEQKSVRPVAYAGFEEGYLETLHVTWADTERGRGPTGTAIRTGKPSTCRNMLTDPAFAPWREQALKRGYASSIVLPLMAEDKAFGAVTIYSRLPEGFSEGEAKLLSDLADDLAYGITAMRLRAAHAEAEKALRESEGRYRALVDAAPDAIIVHREGRLLYANAAALRLYGAETFEQLASLSIMDLVAPTDRKISGDRIKAVMAGATLPLRETTILRLDGRPVAAESIGAPVEFQGARAVQAIMRDITERKQTQREREITIEFLQIVNVSADARTLAQHAVEFLRKHSGCQAVGIRLAEGDDYPYVAATGFPDGFVESENSLAGQGVCDARIPAGAIDRSLEGMCGNVISGRFDASMPYFTQWGSFWTNSTTELNAADSRREAKTPPRNCCNRFGFESVALIPLRMGEKRTGLLQLNDRRKGMFTPASIAFWERLADYVSVALAKLRAEEGLVRAKEEWERTFDSVPDLIAILDDHNRIVRANKAMTEKLACSAEACIGVRCFEKVHGTDAPPAFCPHALTLKDGNEHTAEVHESKLGGDFLVSTTPLRDEEGRMIGSVHVARDITQRKRIEEALRETSEYLQNLIDYANAPIIVWDPSFRITRFNHAFERLTGRRAADVAGRELSILFAPESREESMAHIRETATGERWETVEIPILHMDGSVRTVLWNSATLFAPDGATPVATIAQGQDITSRKETEQALRETSERLENLINYANAPIIVWDGAFRITRFNHAFERLTGLRAADVLGRNLDVLFPEDSREKSMAFIRQTATGERWETVEIPIRHVSANVRTVLWNSATLFGVDGTTPVATIAQGQDITERKQAEETLKRTADELSRSNKDLEQFAYVASHDLQEPLRMVSGFMQLLEQKYRSHIDAQADQYIHYAVDGAKRMQTLIDDLLTYSRVGRRGGELVVTDPNAALVRAMAGLRAAIEESKAEISHGSLPMVRADGSQLAQLFQNLIGNAIKFHGDKPPAVRVNAKRDDGQWVFSVSDNGIGIAPEFRDQIFLIFQRLHTKDKYPGTGIGLAICKKIVERHGGRIWVESQPGRGSTFYFIIPD